MTHFSGHLLFAPLNMIQPASKRRGALSAVRPGHLEIGVLGEDRVPALLDDARLAAKDLQRLRPKKPFGREQRPRDCTCNLAEMRKLVETECMDPTPKMFVKIRCRLSTARRE